jgi:hypothetical protein
MTSDTRSRGERHPPPDRRRRLLLAGMAYGAGMASALSACGGGGPEDDATLRAVNATVDVARIDVLFNDWLFAGDVAYGGAASPYARRRLWDVGPLGRFEVRRAGAWPVLLRDTRTLPDADTASVVIMGQLSSGLTLRLIDEDASRPDGPGVRLRLLHAWPSVGAVDVFVTRADQPLAGRVPTLSLDAHESLSSYAHVPGDGRLRLTPAGRSDLVLFDSASIGLGPQAVATLVLCPAPRAVRAAVTVLPQGQPAFALTSAQA